MLHRRLLIGAGALALLALGALAGCAKPAPTPAPTLAPGVARQVEVSIAVSKPANGTHFVAGEAPTLTITLKDQTGAAFDRANDFSQLRLALAGPQEPTETVTAVKLLKTSADRTQPVHHYVDLTKNPDVTVNGNTLVYKLAGVSDEKPGTYIASVWAVEKADPIQQTMVTAEMQIGTATVETQIVDKSKCAKCHLGADSGKFYFAHIDPGFSPVGNPSIDQGAPQNCKTCHNNDGYAAFVDPATKDTRIADPLVHRVHGIHMGEELKSAHSVGNRETETPGVFEDYLGVVFPNNVKNCNSCHVDDRWKTKPSQLACGACHDNVWFGAVASMPAGDVAHPGGPQANDSACATCHQADTKGVAPSIMEAHKVEQKVNKVDVSLTPPANGKFYVAGEKPIVTLVVRNDKDQPIDHTTVSETTFSTASLFVYGPRMESKPVLTNTAKNGNSKARASVTSTIPAKQQVPTDNTTKGWTFADGDTFKIAVNAGPVQELVFPTGVQTTTQVVDFLKANLKDVTVSANAAGNINLLSNIQGEKSRYEIYNSPVTTKMGWKAAGRDITREGKVVGKTAGVTMEPYVIIGAVSTASNDLRPRKDPLVYTDPSVVRTVGNITYPLDDVATVKPGTYMVYTYLVPAAGKVPDFTLKEARGFMTFQVGTETPDKKVATNCIDCHGSNIMHLDTGPVHSAPFDTDYCKACHDYNRSGTGELGPTLGGTSTSGFFGYGAKPISARVHGVHRGYYLEHSEYIYAGNPDAFSEVIFPQDIRNCSKCHSADTTGTWKTKPSRLACMSCHDSDEANAHAILMTSNPTPADPWSLSRVETCQVCHGEGKDFAVDEVHNISNPYKPPYPRLKTE